MTVRERRPGTGFTPKRLFRVAAVAEAVTWTGLIVAMVAKHGFHLDALMFPAGLAHGTVFVAYAAMQVVVGLNQRWPVGRILAGMATAIVPYATIPWERRLERRGMLEGAWRTEAADDPRDARALDRLLRWGLRNPWLALAIAAVAIATVVLVLLQLGPPTQWFR